jgi:benzoyl-CoA reductase/2-hydroxyglutaryl-CoA dehydratase subunit BcrC/BadD/HgdB
MRPEMKEYNYDWLMGSMLSSASRMPAGTPKETDLACQYIPTFKKAAQSIFGTGDVGTELFKLLARYYENVLTAKEHGKKIVGTTFCNSPVILYAMDIVPVTFEAWTALAQLVWKRGMFDYFDYCVEVGMPETSCSSQRGALGAILAGLTEKIDFIICDTPGVCDTNANAFAFASEFMNVPFFQLNYPSAIGDDRTQKYHVDDYKAMISFIEQHSGKKLDYDRLSEVLKEVDRQDSLMLELEDMMLLKPSPVPPLYQLALYTGRFLFSGHEIFTRLLESMVESAQELAKSGMSGLATGVEKLRTFMCYIDHYTVDLNFWNYLSEKGVAHTGSILTRNYRDNNQYVKGMEGSAYGIDTSSPDAMLDTIAQMNARLPMVRSIRGPYDRKGMWLEESLALAKLTQADCVIYNGTPGCRNTWGMVKPFARDMEKHGYPTHIMYDDAFDDRVESWEATRERLDEFFHVRGLL